MPEASSNVATWVLVYLRNSWSSWNKKQSIQARVAQVNRSNRKGCSHCKNESGLLNFEFPADYRDLKS
jgi:hypothetical protein